MIKSFFNVASATALMGLVAYGQQQQGYAVASDTNPAASAPEIAVFPVRYSADARYLVDQNGVPFPIMGRTAWFVTALAVADYRTFIDDTAARGHSAIELHVVNHDPRGLNPPFNGNGDRPFLNRLDGATWNGSRRHAVRSGIGPARRHPENGDVAGAIGHDQRFIVDEIQSVRTLQCW